MGIRLIRKWLSYIVPIPVESTSSEWNAELHIQLFLGRYRLTTANAIYSFEDKYDNFRGAFQMIDWRKFNPQSTLVLGLGLGSVVQMLEDLFKVNTRCVCVELDEVIVQLAEKYILNHLKSAPEIIIADAKPFLETTAEKYDLILVDIFQDDKIPKYFESENFLQLARDTLSPGGLLIYNRLGYTSRDKAESISFFDNIFQRVFPRAYHRKIHNNIMIFSGSQYLKTKAALAE